MPPAVKSASERTRADYHFFLTYQTRWSDNDQYSHVNNAIYYHLIDSIVNTYLAERCGCVPSTLSATFESADISPIGLVVSSHCEFFAPISFPEVVTLGLRVVKLGRSSVSYEVGFFTEPSSSKPPSENGKNDADGETVQETAKAVGGYTHVFVDRIHRRPVKEMSPTLRNGLQVIAAEFSVKSKL
ncbi:thioesterase family protein [Sanghuangporus baumii]|uniref:Thioesterase family protein n=1 Tax=Sanghuangporus baumii TaxID=108892 RepID=A0A9Q5NA64_SANBA|nr:thioesterase family protein [Sanghuangporus baumii]